MRSTSERRLQRCACVRAGGYVIDATGLGDSQRVLVNMTVGDVATASMVRPAVEASQHNRAQILPGVVAEDHALVERLRAFIARALRYGGGL